MNSEEIHRLVEEYREETLSAADARRLAEAIRADAGVAAAVRQELEFSGHLAQALDGTGDEAFARSFAERLSAERGRDEFMTAFRKRAARTRRVEPPRPSLVPFLVAAGFLLAILAAVVWQNAQPPVAAPVVKQIPPPPVEEPRVAPAPPPPPVPPPAPPEEPKIVVPPVVVPAPAPKPEEPPPPPTKPPEAPKPAPVKPTEVRRAVARLDRVQGEVHLGADPAKAGQEVLAALRVEQGAAQVLLADGSRITVGADTTVREIAKGPKGTRIHLAAGTVTADVARQDQPLVFVTPHAEAKVLGTVLRLVVEASSTRLEVREGKVQLTREGRSAVVAAGQVAVAGPGAPPVARSASPDEIVLLPQHARITGGEWSLQREIRGLTGAVLEAGSTAFKVTDHVETRPSYATYTFYAPAEKEYRIWIRLTSQEKGDPWNRDMVTIEPTRATLSQKSPFFGAAPTTAWVVTGAAATPGFTWVSGHGQEGKVEPPLVVKFRETGFQNIRLYVGHPWVRVDAIWLSATQKTRPAPKVLPP